MMSFLDHVYILRNKTVPERAFLFGYFKLAVDCFVCTTAISLEDLCLCCCFDWAGILEGL